MAVHTSIRPSRADSDGAFSVRAIETTAGSGSPTASSPSSVSRRTRSRPSSSVSSTALVACGHPRNAATSGGTCQVSEASVLPPQRTGAQPPFSIALTIVREGPSVSATAKARSERWMQRSAPRRMHSRSASSACGGPIVIAITSPPPASRSRAASATANASKAFSSSGTPSRLSCFVSWSNSIASGRGICLIRQTIFKGGRLLRVLGILYDIHGNLDALEAVLADAGEIGIDRWLLGGDYGTPSPYPLETLDRLRGLPNATWIRGNGERWLREPPTDRPEVVETYERFRDQVTADVGDWLYNLPPAAALDGILYVHGSPLADDESFAA